MRDDIIEPIPSQPQDADYEDYEDGDDREPVRYRGTGSDPMFGYLIAMGLNFGLLPLIPYNADLRYTLVWGLVGLFGVLAWLFGTTIRIERESVEDIIWGGVFGLIFSVPILLVGGSTLTAAVQRLFQTGIGGTVSGLPIGTVLAFLVFVMPMGETLFFRGYMQQNRAFALVGALSSVWSILLFLPMLDVGRFPLVALIVAIALALVNMVYSYVAERNGLAAAWICQIVVNLVLVFLPFVLSL
jgi:hypothetical protein